jgi:hypothetical protein
LIKLNTYILRLSKVGREGIGETGKNTYQTPTGKQYIRSNLIIKWLFWRWSVRNYRPALASNCNPPDLSVPNSCDYRCAPTPGFLIFAGSLNSGPHSF